jgi:hypothetical protein
MLNPVHIRKKERTERAKTTVSDNTCSFATASTTEINAVAYQQRVSLQEYRLTAAQDPVRKPFVETVGCDTTIEFRKSRDDFNTTPYVCGSGISIPNVPHLCYFCFC